jgi:hypothetical protein
MASAPNSKSVYWKYAPQVIPYDLFLYCSGNSDNCAGYFSDNIESPYCYHCTIY